MSDSKKNMSKEALKEIDMENVINREYSLDKKIAEIASAVRAKSQTFKPIEFTDIANRIENLKPSSESYTPKLVYDEFRLESWLKMPTEEEINNNEIYFLFHIPNNATSLLAFSVTTANGTSYKVDLLDMTEAGTYNTVHTYTINSGSNFDYQLDANDFTSVTENDMKQCMVKITSTGNITEFAVKPSTHRPSPENFICWNIIEISAKLPYLTTLVLRNGSYNDSNSYKKLGKLKFFSLYGPNSITNFDSLFAGLRGLIAINALDTSKGTTFKYFLANCSSLLSVCEFDLVNAIYISDMFYYCRSLPEIKIKNVEKVQNSNGAFGSCYSLTKFSSDLNFNSLNYTWGMFSGCKNLKTLKNIVFNMIDVQMFYDCNNLLKFDNVTVNVWKNKTSTFNNCYNLTNLPNILNYGTEGSYQTTFANCRAIKEITIIMPTSASFCQLNSTFDGCTSLQKIKLVNGNKIGYYIGCFENCKSLISIDGLDFTSCSGTRGAFENCYSLTEVKNFKMPDASYAYFSPKDVFKNCYCLASFTYASDNTFVPNQTNDYKLDLSSCTLGPLGMQNFVDSAPNVTNYTTAKFYVDISNNRGASEAHKQALEAKGWIVTM